MAGGLAFFGARDCELYALRAADGGDSHGQPSHVLAGRSFSVGVIHIIHMKQSGPQEHGSMARG